MKLNRNQTDTNCWEAMTHYGSRSDNPEVTGVLWKVNMEEQRNRDNGSRDGSRKRREGDKNMQLSGCLPGFLVEAVLSFYKLIY